ncbi:MAG: prenyltransferase [Tannerella sp.]|jgi:1,4-dihydroxy-2-naphthoate octaprenyltransferase|nr:prenyltransferase [Tannerella sp.]
MGLLLFNVKRVMGTVRFWIGNSRSKALPQSVLPAILALCMASQKEGFSVWLGLLGVFGVVVGHLGMNLFDDYFDYKVKKTDYRNQMQHKGMRARILKCAYLTSGATTLQRLLVACFVFGAVALAAGFVIFLYRGYVVLLIAALTALLGVSYSGAPIRLSYHGLGEILIGIMFGPMLMTGVYYAACGVFDRSVLFVSVPVGLLVANIVYTHAIMDYEPDKEVGKMTFAVLLKDKKRMLFCLLLLLVAAYGVTVSGVIWGYLSPYCLLSLLTLPMAISLYRLMTEFVRNPERRFSPRFWMGPMGNWPRTQSFGLDWFMIRWMLARNLLSFFCIIMMVILVVSG